MAFSSGNGNFKSPPAPPGAHCWICLDDGPSEKDGGRLLRNCACRGDSAGFAHVSCLAEHARRLSDEIWSNFDGTQSMVAPWYKCLNCEQEHMGDVALAMMEKYDEHTSHLPDESYRRMEALYFLAMTRETKCRDKDSAMQIFERLLVVHQSMEEKNCPVFAGFFVIKANILFKLALIYYKSKALDNVAYLQKGYDCAVEARKIFLDLFGPDSSEAMQSEGLLDSMMELMTGRRSRTLSSKRSHENKEEQESAVQKARQTHASTVQLFGQESSPSLYSATTLANVLVMHGLASEASTLLKDALAKAKRVFGPSHEITLQVEDALVTASAEAIKQSSNLDAAPTPVSVSTGPTVKATITGHPSRPELNMTEVDVLRWTKDNKYIVRLPAGSKFKALALNLIFASGTTLVLRDLTKSPHLNGKEGTIESYDKKQEQYTVAVGESLYVLLHRDNIEVIFPELV